MTEKELAGKFTPPDEKLAALRVVLVRVLEDRIREVNRDLGEGAYGNNAHNLTNYRNGLTWACCQIRELVDAEGKILKEALQDKTWPMDKAGLVMKLFEDGKGKEQKL